MFDVAIIGCGPVGALAACLLGRAGLKVVVLEKEVDLHPLPRAVHLDHEMMRLFQSAGVIDRVLPDMVDTDGHLHVGAAHQAIRYMGTVGMERPFGWSNDWFFYQPELEAHLRAGFADMANVDLRLGAEFTGLVQDQGAVHITYLQDGAAQEVTARWAIASDGSRSPVRKALGVRLDDLKFEEPWLVVDAEVDGPVRFPEIDGVPAEADLQRLSVMMCNPKRPATVVPGRGTHRRWELMLLPGEDDAAMMQPEKVAELLAPYIGHLPHTIIRSATYRFHGLVAEQWQVGQVFLAGDAAHQTPPFFGQGMCHGLRDVANLAWKMAAIVNDGASPAILDTYQAERDSHVRGVIGAAVAAGRYICELDPAKAAERDAEMVARAKAQAGQRQTAHDLVPPIGAGIVLMGSVAAGERFIQPVMADGRKLDDHTGDGWRLFARGPVGAAQGITTVDATTLADGGKVLDWLKSRGVEAVLIRPDHNVFGTGTTDALITARCQMLGLQLENIA
ncbi:bifunctional 3-(3-hydroxy-phenyl)propionate/3-hydroxycinnamic acid hydroxylase [Novosphingobium sp. FSY-8]|uniref:Bifunctional 3-(3-hydroxy-phenyl)propionate/3-hydroxycinnamic acid hydroxylase n=1 Tax=Novosphingobium ovatum TaxID=1908523 RepID=A0ABW9XHW2_9SPHN|nr:bifunctional 3-(3-hydroxy-phenyl)propionate/3-hydroxycinnamic acid hydroxylase [Novosphingobium ovatum]NBC38143.1 bifunctional 3-(3-hydroxy-phenyl)propionate/3-hydroxycinnamic acid hydroxylase [Novosphingobium ovatum]